MNTRKWAEEELTDTYNLNRFVQAQEAHYAQALAEIKCGHKQSHWMWYVFPQYEGLGFSPTSKRFAIKSLAEAEAYLDHPVLGSRLREITGAIMGITGRSANDIFGSPDDLKLQSCATLFASISPTGSAFDQLLDRYFKGVRDSKTLLLLGR